MQSHILLIDLNAFCQMRMGQDLHSIVFEDLIHVDVPVADPVT